MNKIFSCPRCSTTRRCGKYHLYVIELDYQLVKNKRFISKNPHPFPPTSAACKKTD